LRPPSKDLCQTSPLPSSPGSKLGEFVSRGLAIPADDPYATTLKRIDDWTNSEGT
jgi:hypothetical protein